MSNTGVAGAGNDDKNKLEWTVFFCSLILVLAVLGYLVYQVYTATKETPDLVVEAWQDPSDHNPYRYRVLVYNMGGQTAETVTIEVVVKKDGKDVEKAELQIPFVPKESEREGWVNFSKNPALADTVVAHVISYYKP